MDVVEMMVRKMINNVVVDNDEGAEPMTMRVLN